MQGLIRVRNVTEACFAAISNLASFYMWHGNKYLNYSAVLIVGWTLKLKDVWWNDETHFQLTHFRNQHFILILHLDTFGVRIKSVLSSPLLSFPHSHGYNTMFLLLPFPSQTNSIISIRVKPIAWSLKQKQANLIWANSGALCQWIKHRFLLDVTQTYQVTDFPLWVRWWQQTSCAGWERQYEVHVSLPTSLAG